MKKWYENKDFKKIEHFIREETEAVLKLLQYLSKYKTRLGITKKEETGHRKPAPVIPPIQTERVLPLHQKSPAAAMPTTRKPVDARTSAPKKGSAQLAKVEPKSSKKSPAAVRTADRKSSVPLNQFRKHTPTKKPAGKMDRR